MLKPLDNPAGTGQRGRAVLVGGVLRCGLPCQYWLPAAFWILAACCAPGQAEVEAGSCRAGRSSAPRRPAPASPSRIAGHRGCLKVGEAAAEVCFAVLASPAWVPEPYRPAALAAASSEGATLVW